MIPIKNILAGVGLIATTAVCVQAVQQDTTDPEITKKEKLVNDYNVYAIPLPESMDFAGERVPLEDPDIRERMDRELLVNTYWQSNGLLIIKRAEKFFPIIEPILKEEGLPDDFKYLAVIESGLTQAVSPARATGFWQILGGTGKELGLEVNDNVDERYNVELATRAACKYLKKSKDYLGSWTLAAAGYNAGNAGINRRLEAQDVAGYYDLLLGEETGRYVFRILALKEILKEPQKYGFNFTEDDLYQTVPTYKVKVDTAVTDFVKFAQGFGINYKILKIHNPWLREDHLNNASRKLYYIEIPEKGVYSVGQ
ncbi:MULTISPECIES: lytic transglycosylase domain-containing protein [unclassified Leeuwenhoekiella]|uniref:lytic transglycosylase domain-containing protein n=1 Tax=unclassified Leeuwenhoekiella TaxID=2615029 RepID=UPI000C36787D|nr:MULTISPECIES: lytic transglycosylase domain-containing protein [unclassified Leeuwenhoekiella]MAW94760.1 murein transglycosylase [Leeuwenhoekiella sp.]MAW95535.1 murein transglycosylase [Leeuwenhoekiella sp.]MBA82183.1 murein transglycosylase [Leeuwenhoekiella sp.]|tara:strand:+ start:11863 stop:12798 length:936 start_codon:yes stop_codon:yes gene_type:complete